MLALVKADVLALIDAEVLADVLALVDADSDLYTLSETVASWL